MIVYKITNKINGKIYFGITKQSIEKRWYQHKIAANGNKSYPILRAIRKYKSENFLIECIENDIPTDVAEQKERDLILKFETYKSTKGYNATLGGANKFHFTTSTKKRITHALRGKPKTPEHAQKIRNHLSKMNIPGARAKTFEITFPDGHKEVIVGLKQFCQIHNLCPQNLGQTGKGKTHKHKGFSCLRV